MSGEAWRVIRRPEYPSDLDAIHAWMGRDNKTAAIDMWLLIDEQVDKLINPHFPRRASSRIQGACSVSRSFVHAKAKRRQYKRTASEADKVHG